MSLGRNPINKFIEAILYFEEGGKVKTFDVKVPFCYAMTVETSDPNIAKARVTWEYFLKDGSKLDELIKEIESQPFKVKVVRVEPVTRQLIDLCPRCHKHGVPKIEKKNTSDNRARSWRNKEETLEKKERPPEYWLTYTHSKRKKCRICQYINTPNPSYKKNTLDIERYFFPRVVGEMKRNSFWYAD